MKLVINGEEQSMAGPITVEGLIEQLGMKPDRVAVELNQEIVSRDQWSVTPLKESDRLEIVHFVGGGSEWLPGSFSFTIEPGRRCIMKRLLPWALLMTGSLLVAAWAQDPTQFYPGFNLFSKEQDVQLGQEKAAEVRKHMTVVHNPYLNEYVTRVGKRLVSSREAQQSGFPFTFEVLADRSINAFALPGGPMFINTGLLRVVDNEAQLAGVMGHEMSHVILRHGTNQASKSELVAIPASLGAQVTSNSIWSKLISEGNDGLLVKFSRSAESQADLMGSHLMAEAGYDPIELAHFFEKLNAEGGSKAPQFLSDHPNPENREKAIEQEIQRLPQQPYGYQTGEFQRMKLMVSAIHEPKLSTPPPKMQ